MSSLGTLSSAHDHIPFLRESLRAQYPAAPLQAKGPAIISIFVFLFFVLIGLILNSQSNDSDIIFLVFFMVGGFLSAITYFLASRVFRADTQKSLHRLIMSNYDMLIGRMHGWGFSAAAQTCQSLLEKTLSIHSSSPLLFQTLDEIIHVFLVNFAQIGHAKILIGNENDLKRHSDRVASAFGQQTDSASTRNITAARIELAALELRIEKLEDITKCALFLTDELKRIQDITAHAFSNSGVPENITLDDIHQKLARERFQITERLQAELSKIGL